MWHTGPRAHFLLKLGLLSQLSLFLGNCFKVSQFLEESSGRLVLSQDSDRVTKCIGTVLNEYPAVGGFPLGHTAGRHIPKVLGQVRGGHHRSEWRSFVSHGIHLYVAGRRLTLKLRKSHCACWSPAVRISRGAEKKANPGDMPSTSGRPADF